MNKKILSVFLALAMLISSMSTALAAKKNYADEPDAAGSNIYALWGGFEEDACLKMINKQSSSISTTIVRGGAAGTKNALKIDTTNAGSSKDVSIKFPSVVGETYDISFYLKTDTEGVSQCGVITSFAGNGWNYFNPIPTMAVGTWTKYTLTYVCTGINTNGVQTEGGGSLQFRFGGNSAAKAGIYYLDEIEVVPHGTVVADYSVVNDGFAPSDEEVEEIDTAVIAEQTDIVQFSDVTGHWAETTIETLASYDYVAGMGDGTYSPNTQVTRAQFIKMVADLYGIIAPEYDGRFADVKGDEWFAGYLMIADMLGLINDAMKADGNIYPDKAITREEAATIAALVAKDRGAAVNENNATSFTDDAAISAWAKEGVKNAAAYGMIKGYDTGDYKPAANITRAEAAQILFRVVEIKSRMLIYVDAQNGSDKNDGTQAAPLKSIEKARDLAATYATSMENDIRILMRGRFKLNKTITFNENHSGANGYNIIYTSWGTEKPVVTMAEQVTGFQLYDEELNIYRAYVGKGTETRQAYFNGKKGIRSRSVGYLKNGEYVDKAYWLCDNTELLDFEHPEELDMVFHINWCNPRAMVAAIEETTDGRVLIRPSQPQYKFVAVRVDFALGRPCTVPSYLENALELVNEKGEWYLSKTDGYLYYIPRTGEDMSTMVAEVPTGEWMMNTSVSDYTTPWSNVTFENIIFEGTTWMRPTEVGGHADAQNNHIRENGDSLTGAAISFDKCTNINFYNNRFQNMGVTALELLDGADHCEIIGNRFDVISASAISIDGHKLTAVCADPNQRAPESYVEYIKVNNNYITNTAQDYKSAAAVSFAWPRYSEFNHNEIAYTSYSGFHGSYGWASYANTGTVLEGVQTNYNYVHDMFTDRVYDGGGWYTVGASAYKGDQKKYINECFGNYFTNSWTCAYIYPDEGTTGWHYKNNVVDASMVHYLENNLETAVERAPWFAHMHATTITNLVFENNFSSEGNDFAYQYGWMNAQESEIEPLNFFPGGQPGAEAQAIIDNAGLEPEYAARWADELSGAQFLACDDRRQAPDLNTPFDGGFLVLGHDFGKIYDISDYEIDIWCDDPEAISIDDNGMVTVHKKGVWEAEAVMTIGKHTYLKHLKYEAGDEVERLDFNAQNIAIVEGGTVQYSLNAYTTFGLTYDVTKDAEINLKVEDESVVKMAIVPKYGDEKSKAIEISYVGEGETRIYGTLEYEGIVVEVDIPAKTIKYSNPEAANLPFREIKLTSGWKNTPSPVAGGGVNVTGSPNHYGGNVSNELIAFDMICNPGNTWPSLTLCDNDQMGSYKENDCYMIGIKSDIIELQRFNGGERTMIFGDQSYQPIGGPGLPNLDGNKVIEYGKRYSIVVGAIKEGDATRIVLNVNGKNVFDFYDTNDNRLDPTAKSFFAIYNPSSSGGGFVFYPYTGITDAE